MYSPYGSYSSMGSPAHPMEIPTSSYLSSAPQQGTGYNSYSYSASCAFPSWPQRSSLHEQSDHQQQGRATSYLSDDDLFPCDGLEDDAHSVSSSGSATPTSPHVVAVDDALRRDHQMAVQREALKFLLSEKERRRQQFKKQRRSSSGSSSKKSSKSTHLDAITESGE
ncbi:hypothetical protein GGR52DRAFT_42718 [Hypoxylon sp. FL1284]|nr:hypothetical protein GGR52DRAFT_42718 [Hypoxylon sp. FL1284]